MKVYTLWHEGDEGDPPWIIDAIDDLTVENNDFPDEYLKKRSNPLVREMVIDIPDKAVLGLFGSPTVKATVIE